MVFEPTFNEIDHEADQLPDLTGDEVAVSAADGSGPMEDAEDGTAEASADGELAAADVRANDLPPYGEQ